MTALPESEREAFEKCFRGFDLRLDPESEDGAYLDDGVDKAWLAWLSRAKLAAPVAQPSGELEFALIAECERAMKQRDEFLRTGKSTAGHGGSHDTCFGFILKKYAAPLPEGPAVAALRELVRLDDQYRPQPAPHELAAAWDAARKALSLPAGEQP